MFVLFWVFVSLFPDALSKEKFSDLAPIRECLVQLKESLDELSGEKDLFVVNFEGLSLNVNCLHSAVPEHDSDRSLSDRFSISEPSFECVRTDGILCNGSIGSVLLQSAFSADRNEPSFSRVQYLLQDWLHDRCFFYDDAEVLSDCLYEFGKFRFVIPTYDSEDKVSVMGNMAEWLQLDNDPLNEFTFDLNSNESAKDFESSLLTDLDREFWSYIEEHPEEAESDYPAIYERFYSPENGYRKEEL